MYLLNNPKIYMTVLLIAGSDPERVTIIESTGLNP